MSTTFCNRKHLPVEEGLDSATKKTIDGIQHELKLVDAISRSEAVPSSSKADEGVYELSYEIVGGDHRNFYYDFPSMKKRVLHISRLLYVPFIAL